MKQTEWKIIYTGEGKIATRALELLYKEAGQHLIREQGVYRLYVLPCEKEGAEFAKNTILLGLYEESREIKKYVSPEEVPEGGFAVKIVESPADPEEGRIVILTAHEESELLYAAIHFLDDYIPANAPLHGSNAMPDLIYGWDLPKDARKPSPFSVLDASRKLAVPVEQILVVDDLKPGYDMARSAGADFAAAGWAYDVPEIESSMRSMCDHSLKTIEELRALIFG